MLFLSSCVGCCFCQWDFIAIRFLSYTVDRKGFILVEIRHQHENQKDDSQQAGKEKELTCLEHKKEIQFNTKQIYMRP